MQRSAPTSPRSITALSVVHGLGLCAKNEKLAHLVDPTLAILNARLFDILMKKYPVNKGWLIYKSLTIFSASVQTKIMGKYAVGAPQHLAMRKRLIEQQVRQAICEGARQVLIVGAGYDLLATRLHTEYPNVTFIELDRGETRATKLAIIDRFIMKGLIQKKDNLIFHDCDLSQKDWQSTLSQIDYDKTKKSIAILEGLTMYLTMEQNTALLQVLKDEVLGESSKIILSFNETNKYVIANKTFSAIVAEAGESYLSELTPNGVMAFAHNMNLTVLGKAPSLYLQERSGNGDAIAHAATKDLLVEHYYLLGTTPPDANAAPSNINDVPNIEITVPPRIEQNEKCTIS